MPRYIVTLTNEEMQELKSLIQKGGKGYRIKHAQILLKLDQKPENEAWTYDRIKDAYGSSHSTIAGMPALFMWNTMRCSRWSLSEIGSNGGMCFKNTMSDSKYLGRPFFIQSMTAHPTASGMGRVSGLCVLCCISDSYLFSQLKLLKRKFLISLILNPRISKERTGGGLNKGLSENRQSKTEEDVIHTSHILL